MFAPAGSAASPAAQTDRTLTLKQNTLTPMSKQSPDLSTRRGHAGVCQSTQRPSSSTQETTASTWRSRRPDTGAEILTYW